MLREERCVEADTVDRIWQHGPVGVAAWRSQNCFSARKAPCQPWYQTVPVVAFTEIIPWVLPLSVVSSV